MGSMTTLPRGRALTRADLRATADDGRRYELLDGVLLVSPSPSLRHQRCVLELAVLLREACPPGLSVVIGPFDVVLGVDTVLVPDLLVARSGDLTERELPVAPLLAVEVLSPSTRRFDLMTKRSRYEGSGTTAYWVVDPDEPALTAWELTVGGHYVEVAAVTGSQAFRCRSPMSVEVVPARLVPSGDRSG